MSRSAEIQCLADSMRGEDTPLSGAVRTRCADLTAMLIRDDGFAEKFFDAMVRKMRAARGPGW